MQLLYALMMVAGLAVCFGGIYFRKVFAGICGFINGALVGLVIGILIALSQGDDSYIIIITIIAAALFSIISVVFEKIFATISAFVCSFVVVVLLMVTAIQSDNMTMVLIVGLLVASLAAVLSYVYYKYSFAAVTAFTGGLTASIGGNLLFTNNSLWDYIWYGPEGVVTIILMAFVLAILGFIVQIQGVKKKEEILKKIENGEIFGADITMMLNGKWVEEIKIHAIVIIIPVIAFIIFAILNVAQYNSDSWSSWYSVQYWLETIVKAAAVSCLTYATLKLSSVCCFIIQGIYLVGYLIQNIQLFAWEIFSSIIGLATMSIVWAVVYVIKTKIKEESWKPLFALCAAALLYEIIVPAIRYGAAYFGIYNAVSIVVQIIALALLMKMYEQINIFSFMSKVEVTRKAGNSGNDQGKQIHIHEEAIKNSNVTDKIKCTNCGQKMEAGSLFCKRCGAEVSKMQFDTSQNEKPDTQDSVCASCGVVIEKEWKFCKKCGAQLK